MLRGTESDDDAQFVQDFCSAQGLKFVSKSFDSTSISRTQKKSIQETARILRYEWFEEIRNEQDYNFIATAHNLSDNAETLLINQLRGTGLDGIKGIPSKRDAIIRPMLTFSSSDIRHYANQHNVKFRADSSNQSDKYLRNAIRLNIAPHLFSIEPSFEQVFKENATKFSESADLLDAFVAKFKNANVRSKYGQLYIPIDSLLSYPHPHIILSKLLSTAHFDFNQLKQILDTKTVGKFIESESHTLHYDRSNLVFQSKELIQHADVIVKAIDTYGHGNHSIQVSKIKCGEVSIPLLKNEIVLNIDLDTDSLQIRSWQQTDRIHPFGMDGSKLVSDVLIDNKIPQPLKSSIPIFTVNNHICWIAGLCFSHAFKVDFENMNPDHNLIHISLLEG
jgi:tRNA(Ile)-lysidine synthase